MNNIITNEEVEVKLEKIKKQSDLRTKYFDLIEKELKEKDLDGFIYNSQIKKLELKIKENK